ncbi:MAG TPA: ABC transporter permease [Bacillota bacterium]|nr:ABC transporter permease [Bacillota bacterium]
MRMWSLLRGDIRIQYKYGFYFLYMFFTILYIGLLLAFPEAWREKAAILMIFSDPAAMGLYFMGAIVLFEKSERVLDSIAVSPARTYEYTLSKLFSIGVISVVVGFAIGFFSNAVNITTHLIMGIFLCSCLFSAVGLVIAVKSISLNGFIISTVPAQLLINIPAVAWLFGWKPGWLLLHPGVSMMELFENGKHVLPAFMILAFWTLLAAVTANRTVKGMFREIGGIKL